MRDNIIEDWMLTANKSPFKVGDQVIGFPDKSGFIYEKDGLKLIDSYKVLEDGRTHRSWWLFDGVRNCGNKEQFRAAIKK